MQHLMRGTAFAVLGLVTMRAAEAVRARQSSEANANPIRKVVTLLQSMQKKVDEEGETEKKLYEKFMCYCKTGGSDLQASISGAEAKVPAVSSDIEAAEGKLAQTKEGLKQAQVDRSAAKDAMKEATALREKEAAAFGAEKAEYDANIAAIKSAVSALTKGMAGGFLQTGGAQVLRQLVSKASMPEGDRQELASFLSVATGGEYVPRSGEITGILKEMGDTMSKGLADATTAEAAAIKSYEELMAAKKKETVALTASVESKTKQIGELGVQIVNMKEDLSDTEAALAQDQKFLGNMKESCATKTAEWEERSKTRADELVALAETIKVLNDDDAQDLFKKTLPSASASFIQVSAGVAAHRERALGSLRAAVLASRPEDRAGLDLLVLALSSKKALSRGGFDKVIKMIDSMVEVLKTEQLDDDHKREYCAKQFDVSDDKKKALERTVSDEESAIAAAKDGIASLAAEIAALEASIAELDKSVAAATEQRKQEHSDFQDLLASDTAAKELLGIAKNHLNRFYNPKLYAPPPKRELSREDRIAVNMGGTAPPTPAPGGIAGTGVTVFAQLAAQRDAPSPPPDTWDAYAKKSQESTGVIAMIDLLIKDLDKELAEAETEEKDAQADYEKLMGDSAAKRTSDSKSLTDKGAAKASLEEDLEDHKGSKKDAGAELMATLKYISSLHSECDWLLQYFDVRKEARAGEVDSLMKAKAVLSGADYS
eukprot:CAMPEP_0204590630 /NCGR_PEP_ID=MMETSP0661-20131031/49898_1 /ASSEMBLY_ACC=CAM_ASM_000606 /TAXON_ID=109239 /ORGANISM="Alexandrium margalefi, Strain AMGDE01CS-322" /LENGTH=715 /DNA_ID=CAMNT_0051600679 /DNA_START=48 /DNA_END=2195 /DNA_ORIENTATION=+